MAKVQITHDPDGPSAEVDNPEGSVPALAVATRLLHERFSAAGFFENSEHGIDLNQDASAGGTPVNIHDGTDLTLWTASSIQGGKFTFNSNDHAYQGIATIVDYTLIDAGETVTITVDTVQTVLTAGGTDWTAATSNAATATSLASAIDGVSGVSATATAAIVTVIADAGSDITELVTSGTAGELIVSALSVKIDNAAQSDVMDFDKGSDQDWSAYVSASLRVYVDKDWSAGDSISLYGYDTGLATQVGDKILLEDYFNFGSFDVWQKISIPLSDFGVLSSSTTADSIRMEIQEKDGKSPKFYLDLVRIEETGTPIAFTVTPESNTWLYITDIRYSFAKVVDSTLANATMNKLSYDDILGSSLSPGFVYSRTSKGSIAFSNANKSISDFMRFPLSTKETFADATKQWLTLTAGTAVPLILKAQDIDQLKITISEDMSGYAHVNVAFVGWTEVRG